MTAYFQQPIHALDGNELWRSSMCFQYMLSMYGGVENLACWTNKIFRMVYCAVRVAALGQTSVGRPFIAENWASERYVFFY